MRVARVALCANGALLSAWLLHSDRGPIWSGIDNRVVTPKELASSMGFVVYRDIADRLQVPVNFGDSEDILKADTLGNAMHLACVGVVLACALGSTRLADPAQLA